MEPRTVESPKVLTEAKEAAKAVGLRYASDSKPGIRRIRAGQGFRYIDPSGKTLSNSQTLARIKSLAVPPAWTNVWTCPDANGHLQATGRDARGRKQHRYHREWREVRDETKYNRIVAFGKALPKIRARTRRDIRRSGLGRRKVLAAIVRLLEISAIRVGNQEYAQANNSYGLTTLKDHHAEVSGARIRFEFRGKGGKQHEIDINHPIVARIVKKCQDLPGQELFQYVDDAGVRHDITSGDVNDYLREIARQDFTANDFRTWTGTVLAALVLREFEEFETKEQARKNIIQAIERVAKWLGNTPSVCKKCYVHPVILDSYLDGSLVRVLQNQAERELVNRVKKLRPEEAAVLALLRQRLKETKDELGTLKRKLDQSVRREQRKRVSRSRSAPPKYRDVPRFGWR